MPKYSNTSKKRLRTCHLDLQVLMYEVIKYIDVSIICGYRPEDNQNEAFRNGFSTKEYPDSNHNKTNEKGEPESKAVDAVPYPIEWKNIPRMRFFNGIILGIAIWLKRTGRMRYCIRLGMDWDSDSFLKDQRFNDYPHIELTTKNLY